VTVQLARPFRESVPRRRRNDDEQRRETPTYCKKHEPHSHASPAECLCKGVDLASLRALLRQVIVRDAIHGT
jgi:hypothetical protein